MLELFYLAEFIVFIEYTEMIMPMIYSVYTFILPKRWNHEYYSFFEGHLGTKVLPKLTNISLYVLAEALSFLVLAVILWRHLRFSLVHQLAFNFESRHVSIQSKLIGWVIYIVQNAMMQYVVVCLWTPVPAIAMVTLLDCIPLEAPSKGPNNICIWIRIALTAGIVTALMLNQCQSLTPWMRLTPRFVTMLGATAGVVSGLTSWQLARVVGYPLPFSMLLGTPNVVLLVVIAVLLSQREHFRDIPDARRDILRYYWVLNCQFFMTIVYPLFNYVFGVVSPSQQTAIVLLLPLIKIICKLWIHYALKDIQDAKPEMIIFNVEVFHALFVAHCMQNSTSKRTVLVLVLFDLGHAWISLTDVRRVLRELRRLAPKSKSRDSTKNIVEFAMTILDKDPELCRSVASDAICRQGPPTILVAPQQVKALNGETDQASTTAQQEQLARKQRRLFVEKVFELLYLTEFIVFIEYTEVIVPVIYSVYSLILSCMWNHEYYGFLKSWSSSTFLDQFANISLYVLAEILSLTLMAVVLWWHLRFSLVHQLAFNLEKRQVHIQSKLVGWVIYIVQNAMVQYGVYSLILSCIWNHEHYGFLKTWSTVSILSNLGNVALYVVAEALSLMLLAVVLWWHLRFSLVHQLAFNLEKRQVHIQSKLVGWVIYLVQNAMIQYVIKTTCKLWIHHALKDTQDTKPEVIIFNVEVFHALFVAHCMQNSTSTRTVLVLVAFDLAHGYLSFMDVRRLLNELRRLNPKSDGQDSLKDILEAAIDALRREPELFETTAVTTIAEPRKSIRLSNQVAPEIPAVPKPAPKMADLRGPSRGDFAASFRHIGRDQRRLFVKKVLELLYLTEFIVFIEYTEVIVPVIYSVYSLILSYMWNREYYMFLHGWSAATFLDRFANISLYVLAEALSLVLMAVVLWWYLRFSLVHQLAFNLETRQVHIQSKLVGWVIYIVQNAMVQYVPFNMLVGTPPVVILVVLALFWSQREHVRNIPHARRDILRYIHVLNCQSCMTIVYPQFNHMFTKATSSQQTWLVLLMPIIKTTCKLWIHYALRDAHEGKPEVIIFNVEVFHALFVAHCMQKSTSKKTVLMLVAFDLAHGVVSLVDVRRLL
ncbi:hypothetical protein Poli38472_004755 [Pythium oligandrum]|uniref:Uncharacterized protein n=1 Tax=Pythium oligandrum TaxID=41045 RepID=A0A8K1FEQ5_PYTOL|nr:hypothetical protein Poli38472_004755 [Pythium oligandrum]|eukprot:TMW59686.1 hypothetical protein Poli38472_004755 [Pythium oligandrum]